MARPHVPLISREKVCQVALEMIDAEGIDALTIRAIALRLNVNGASLYHHFHNKDEILAGAADLALADARTPRLGKEDWKSWCFRNVVRLRAVLRQHPDIIPTLIRRQSLHIGLTDTEYYFGEFEQQGLPIGLALTLMESLQAYAIGVVMHEASADAVDPDSLSELPVTARAVSERMLNRDEEFELGCKGLIDAIENAANGRTSYNGTSGRTEAVGRGNATKPRSRRRPKAS